MIPIIYEKDEVAFITNGLGRLRDCLTCTVTEERNGIYECEFTYPVDGANYDLIIPGRIITVTHDDTGDIQPFDIVSYSRPIDGIVTFRAVHISYRLREKVMQTVGTTVSDLTTAISMMNAGNYGFTFSTDFTASGYCSAFGDVPRSARQVLGGMEGSMLDAYGGEYKFDKWTVQLLKARGVARDLTIRYGVNMMDFEEEADFSSTYNVAIPYWEKDGNVIFGNPVYHGSKATYAHRNIAHCMDLSDKYENSPTRAQLEAKAESIMNRKKPWLPEQNIKVNFIRLQDSPEYEQYAPLMTCSLCDTINMVFPRYNVSGTFKIVRIVWDVLQGRYVEMELGDLKTTLSEALGVGNSTSSSGGGGSDGIASCTTIPAGQAIAFDTGTTWTDISSTTYPDNCSITLSNPGVYILFGTVAFASNASGRRAIRWYDVTGNEAIVRTQVVLTPANGAITYMQTITCVQITSSNTYKLQAYQNSGSQLNVTPYRSYVQIAAVPQARGVSF